MQQIRAFFVFFSGERSTESSLNEKRQNADSLVHLSAHASWHAGSSLSLSVLVKTDFYRLYSPPPHTHSQVHSFSHRFLLVFCRTGRAPSLHCSLSQPPLLPARSHFELSIKFLKVFKMLLVSRSLSSRDSAPLACEEGEERPEHALTGSCIAELL